MIGSRGIELRPGPRRSDFAQQCDYRNPRLLDTRRRVLRRVPYYPGGPLETELNARECDGKATHEITVQSLRAGERRNARQQVAFTFRILQREHRISFEPGNFRYDTLTFRQRLDQTAIKLVDTVAK